MSEYGYRNLLVWQKAKALAVDVYQLTKSDVIRHDFSLIDQMRRSAVSVPGNIAEGDERKSDKESVRFFHIAKGSLAELSTQLEIAHDVGYFTSAQVEPPMCRTWQNDWSLDPRPQRCLASHPKPTAACLNIFYEHGVKKNVSV